MADEDTTLNEDSVQDQQDTQDQAEVDWQKRYTDTQAEYTRQQQALKDAESVWEDEQALLSRIGEKYPHLIADEETVEDDDSSDDYDDEPEVMTKAEFEAWQDEQHAFAQAEKGAAEYEANLKRFVGDRELDQYGDAALRSVTYKNAEEHEQAVNAYFEYLDSLGSKPRKKRPSPSPAGGQAVTGVPNYDQMSREQATDAMVERARALESQT